MQPSLLEEIPQVPNPYPVVSKVEYPDVWRLCVQARELAWDPVGDVDYSDLRNADLPPEVRRAAEPVVSRRSTLPPPVRTLTP